MTANATGKIHYSNDIRNNTAVKEGQYLAVMQNAADSGELSKIISILRSNRNKLYNYGYLLRILPKNVSLGELNPYYYGLLKAINDCHDFYSLNAIGQEIHGLKNQTEQSRKILSYQQDELAQKNENLSISYRLLTRDSVLHQQEVLSDVDYDKSSLSHKSSVAAHYQLHKEMEANRENIIGNADKITQLQITKSAKENELQLSLVSSYDAMLSNFLLWEEKYVIKAPISGKIELLGFIKNNDYVLTGQEIMAVVPEKTGLRGEMYLPTIGAGKVKVGSEVIVKLDNYPYEEFGSINGTVLSVSQIPKQKSGQDQALKTQTTTPNDYLVLVGFPDSLKTNYGTKLKFQYDLKGAGEIVANKRRLIERLFDNLRYRTEKK
ncbi:HlyD family secretion protein [Niabella sp. CC-SYL272]|uniref:HlyD family secretion protein n=1 Tax=Niabella agricola TaxID=2891571 RepID=UPI001F29A05E|nr:HlyD family efflux transporter periplasmic adaptor subunit [Niabella agricola]MCF3108538.1 HlyD family secretion protein [Niabella agricola]